MATIKHASSAKRKLTDEIRRMIEAETADKPQPKKDARNDKSNPRHDK